MTEVRHEAAFQALQALEAALRKSDVAQSQAAMEVVERLLRETPAVGDDVRLLPLFQQCERLAQALRDVLGDAVRTLATSGAAARAYDRGSGEGP